MVTDQAKTHTHGPIVYRGDYDDVLIQNQTQPGLRAARYEPSADQGIPMIELRGREWCREENSSQPVSLWPMKQAARWVPAANTRIAGARLSS